jgi:oxygen-independent coproporphyrinogen-3 oxidase
MISLYFHIPFCKKKCPYCHFFVLPDKEELKKQLLEALHLEWNKQLPLLEGKEIASIYFGGGTPSLFGPKAIEMILSWTRLLKLAPACEITLEANPEEGEELLPYASVGINRMSLGVQSLDSATLLQLGRAHTQEKALSTIVSLHDAGIKNLSIDLMFDVPTQTVASFDRTLKLVQTLPITHLSLYNLTFEPHTVFFKREKELTPLLPSPEESLELLQLAVIRLEEMELHRYEISAFAKQGYQAVHNVGYWTARPFLGFGPSAFSYWEKKRFRNIAHLGKYEEALASGKSPVDFEEQLAYPDNLHELLAVELRLLRGVCVDQFQKKHGKLPATTHEILDQLIQKGWLTQDNSRLHLSERGLLFYDSVASELI